MSDRRAVWRTLYSDTLPRLARSKDSAQPVWPVTLDHCFGRIILDHVVGEGRSAWTQVIRGPAVKNMTDEQVEGCIALGEKIANGQVNLVKLDEKSLYVRGKKSKHFAEAQGDDEEGRVRGTKRKRCDGLDEKATGKQLKGSEDDVALEHDSTEEDAAATEEEDRPEHEREEDRGRRGRMSRQDEQLKDPKVREQDRQKAEEFAKKRRANASLPELRSIVESSSLAPYRKEILLALLQVPKGKYTTYGAISDFLGSSPRAVGNGMRHNPFAPEVPCHRVLAADGKIGGYCGQWGQGDLIEKKRKILREEGVRFDGKGKVVGGVWRGFK